MFYDHCKEFCGDNEFTLRNTSTTHVFGSPVKQRLSLVTTLDVAYRLVSEESGYKVLDRNCDSFINLICYGKMISKQTSWKQKLHNDRNNSMMDLFKIPNEIPRIDRKGKQVVTFSN